MTEPMDERKLFLDALQQFVRAGMNLADHWDQADGFHADELAPLPDRLAPPLSLDEWLGELQEHYEEALRPSGVVDLDRIASLLRDRGYENAYVEQTGGGVATLFAGPTHEDPEWGTRYAVVAGPGWFAGPGWRNARADLNDFVYGPDDDGTAPVESIRNGTEEEVAARLADFLEAVAL